MTRNQPLKRSQPKRDWHDAENKRGPCRICGTPWAELAHTISREKQDQQRNVMFFDGPGVAASSCVLWVNPDSVVPLCKSHHEAYDARRLDLLPYLNLKEQVNAVLGAGGIALAYKRLTGDRNA